MITVGVDVHKRECTVVIQAEDGEQKCLSPMKNTREDWRKLLDQLPPDTEIALEVSTSGYFAMSVIEEAGWLNRTHWVHTAGIDSLRKQKYDRLDAERLARKVMIAKQEPLPEAWFPPAEIRLPAYRCATCFRPVYPGALATRYQLQAVRATRWYGAVAGSLFRLVRDHLRAVIRDVSRGAGKASKGISINRRFSNSGQRALVRLDGQFEPKRLHPFPLRFWTLRRDEILPQAHFTEFHRNPHPA